MIWGDLILPHTPTRVSLPSILGVAFGVPADQVSVVTSIECSSRMPVIAEISEVSGEFTQCVTIYLDASIRLRSLLCVALSVAQSACCSVLISDEEINPYTMILVSRSGTWKRVTLDPEALDHRGEYRLS